MDMFRFYSFTYETIILAVNYHESCGISYNLLSIHKSGIFMKFYDMSVKI